VYFVQSVKKKKKMSLLNFEIVCPKRKRLTLPS